jgi:hypothetical protein
MEASSLKISSLQEVFDIKEKLVYVKKNWINEPSLIVFVFTYLYTIILIVTIIIDYLTKNFRTPEELIQVYQWLLAIYVTFKASDRWILKLRWKSRSGEFFVVAWLLLTTAMYLSEYFTEGQYTTPPAIINITKEVLIIFAFSKSLKYIYEKITSEEEKHPPPAINLNTRENEIGPTTLILED